MRLFYYLLIGLGLGIFALANLFFAKHNIFRNDTVSVAFDPIPFLPTHLHSPEDAASNHLVFLNKSLIPENDLWIHSVSLEMNNVPDPERIFHHSFIEDTNTKDPFCDSRNKALVAAGTPLFYRGHGKFTYPDGYALFLKKGVPLQFVVALHNPDYSIGSFKDERAKSYKDVRVLVKLGRASPSEGLMPVTLYKIDLSCSESMGITVPANSKNIKLSSSKYPIVFEADGIIDYIRAHFHLRPPTLPENYGGKFTFYLNGEALWHFDRENIRKDEKVWFGNKGRDIYHVSIAVKRGDKLWIDAYLSNPEKRDNSHAMAAFGFLFLPK